MKKITAIGEILYDVYPDKKHLGGAPFNFIYHVWKILGKANFISSVGNDENGKEILVYLSSIGFNTDFFNIDNQHATGTVQVKLDENKIPHFIISPESSYDYIELNKKTENLVNHETDLIYFGTLTTRNAFSRNTVLSLLGNKKVKYFCDLNLRHNFFTKELVQAILHASQVIKINEGELEKLKEFFDLDSSCEKAAEQLLNNFNIDLIGLTLGGNGSILFTKTESNKRCALSENVIDTLGAGDAFAAIFCLGYLYHLPIKEINKLANEFAADICLIHGALPADDIVYKKYRAIFCEQ